MADNKNKRPSQAAVALGVLLIFVGVYSLLNKFVPYDIWFAMGTAVKNVWSITWPLALVVAGIYLLWASKTGKLAGFAAVHTNGSLRRSRMDRKILGVCGGIAYYFAVDSTIVRVIAVILVFLMGFMAVVAYFLLALLIPSA